MVTEAIVLYDAALLPGYTMPEKIGFHGFLPGISCGKIDRKRIRDMFNKATNNADK